jgi:hypothetical protein
MAGRLRGRLPVTLGSSFVTTSWGQGRAEDRSNRDMNRADVKWHGMEF